MATKRKQRVRSDAHPRYRTFRALVNDTPADATLLATCAELHGMVVLDVVDSYGQGYRVSFEKDGTYTARAISLAAADKDRLLGVSEMRQLYLAHPELEKYAEAYHD